MINPKLLGVLAAVLFFAVFNVLSNPHREFSTEAYWESAKLANVSDIPQGAFDMGNENGAVLMWAASVTDDPDIISALINRGALINEQDPIFKGTALGAAASQSDSPAIIAELVKHGANVDQRLADGMTALMSAAYWNKDERIAVELIKQGADPTLTNDLGEDALQVAIAQKNTSVISVLEEHFAQASLE